MSSLDGSKESRGGKKKKPEAYPTLQKMTQKKGMAHVICNIQIQKKESILQLKYFSSPDPGTEVSETSAAAAVQESGKGRLLDGNKHGNQGGKQSVLNISH